MPGNSIRFSVSWFNFPVLQSTGIFLAHAYRSVKNQFLIILILQTNRKCQHSENVFWRSLCRGGWNAVSAWYSRNIRNFLVIAAGQSPEVQAGRQRWDGCRRVSHWCAVVSSARSFGRTRFDVAPFGCDVFQQGFLGHETLRCGVRTVKTENLTLLAYVLGPSKTPSMAPLNCIYSVEYCKATTNMLFVFLTFCNWDLN
jgi:hypothetical protein